MNSIPAMSAAFALVIVVGSSVATARDAACPRAMTEAEYRERGGKTTFSKQLPYEPFQIRSTDYLHIYEGQVVFSATILTTGRLRDVRVVRASDQRWVDIMLPRVRAFLYLPPVLNGRSLCITNVEITIDIVPPEEGK